MFSMFSGPLIRQYLLVMTVNLSIYSTGMGLAWTSPVLVKLRDEADTVLVEPMTEEQGSWIVSIGFLVACAAIFLPTMIVDRIGRKYTIISAALTKVAVGLLLIFATKVWMILIARAITGIADLFVFVVVPMYASEMASTKVRGSLGTILQIFSSLGILTMLSLGPFVSYVTLNVILTCIVAVTTAPIFFLPDSPYFLYSRGKTEESLRVLLRVRGSEETALAEMREYEICIANSDIKVDKIQLLRNRAFLKAFAIITISGVAINLIGYNAVQFYLQTILESMNTSLKPQLASVLMGCIQLCAALCTTVITDTFGRKPILIATLIAMGIGMIGLGTFFWLYEDGHKIVGFLNVLPTISLVMVVFSFSAGIASVFWILIGELFEGPTRSIGASGALFASQISGFMVTRFFASLTLSIGAPAIYWIFAGDCFLFMIFIWLVVPETKGKSFAEIQLALGAPMAKGRI